MTNTTQITMTTTVAALGLLASLAMTACEGDEGPGDPGEPGEPGSCSKTEISLAGPSTFPEGIALAEDGRLFIGAIGTGEVVQFSPCDEFPSAFADVGDIAAVGMVVDETSAALWVCASDVTGATGSAIVGYSLDEGAELARHAFPDGGFCNDLIQDPAGNIYATDSFLARIVTVPAADLLSEADASEWLADDRFVVPAGQFGLNGIVIDSADVLHVTNSALGELYRVEIGPDGTATGLTTITVALAGPDGVEVVDDTTLLVVQQFTAELSLIGLDGNAGSLSLVSNRLDAPTTTAIDGDGAWVVEGQIDDLVGATQPDLPFRVVRVPLP